MIYKTLKHSFLLTLCSISFIAAANNNSYAQHIINGQTPEDKDDREPSANSLFAYVQKVKEAIKANWHPKAGLEERSVHVVFSIREDGSVHDIKITKSSGSQEVDQSALEAVQAASPFGQLPPGAPAEIEIQYNFNWQVHADQH